MSLLLAVAVVAVFAGLLRLFALVPRAREAGTRARASLRVLRDPGMADREKERALRRNALRLFGLALVIAAGGSLAIAIPIAGVWLLDRWGLASLADVLRVLQRVDFLLVVLLVAGVAWAVRATVDRS